MYVCQTTDSPRNCYLASHVKESSPTVPQSVLEAASLKTFTSTVTLGKLKHRTDVGGEPQSPRAQKGSQPDICSRAAQAAWTDSAKSSAAVTSPCRHCPRLFHARISLTRHPPYKSKHSPRR